MLNSPTPSDREPQALLRRFGEIDWDFTAQLSESPFSTVHWHPCRFPSQVPALAIGRLCPPGGLVLDPFMGSATTLVEAQRLGRSSIGIDINPVSCLLGAAKTLTESVVEVKHVTDMLRLKLLSSWDRIPPAAVPASVQGDKWYMPSTFAQLRKLWTISCGAQGSGGVIARACFSSVLLSACREDRHWGYVCDNTMPKSDRAPDAKEPFLAALQRLTAANASRSAVGAVFPEARILNENAVSALSQLPTGHVDCIVTSPPYFGVTDYVKAQRLTMEWISQEIEPLRRCEIGARSKRHRQSALYDYLRELDIVVEQIHRVLKKGAAAIIVFGQSPSRPDAQIGFVEKLRALGFLLYLERERHIPVGRRQVPSLVRETVFVVRK
jgi:hypothetical protein